MKNRYILTTLFVLLFTLPGMVFAQQTPTVNPTPQTTTPKKKAKKKIKAVLTPSPTPTATPRPRWIPPPPIGDDDRFLKYQLFSAFQSDINGSSLDTYADIIFRRRLDQYDTSAEGDIRVGKSFSNSDTAQTLELMTGKISYSPPFLTFTVGRLNMGESLSPMQFFGNYSTMGITRADGIEVTLPISVSLGVQDLEKIESTSTALSFYYFPSLLSAQYVNYDTSQSFLLGQLRIAVSIFNMPFVFRFNGAGTSTNYFTYSSLSGNMAYDGAVECTFTPDFNLYGEFGDQNSNLFSETDVVAIGLKARKIYTFGAISIDQAAIEMQLPLTNSENNIFVGGNQFSPSLATTPQESFFGHVKARISAVNILFSITNTPGDFTFARVLSNNSAFPLSNTIGLANQVPILELPLVSKGYDNWAYNLACEVEF